MTRLHTDAHEVISRTNSRCDHGTRTTHGVGGDDDENDKEVQHPCIVVVTNAVITAGIHRL